MTTVKVATDSIEAGDIRLALSLDKTLQCFVLVLAVHSEFLVVCLLSNEKDMMSDYDVLLSRDRTLLPYDLVAQTDLTSRIYPIQARKFFGLLDAEMVSSLVHASNGDFSGIESSLRGMPIRGKSDPRWKNKKHELMVLQDLSRECNVGVDYE